MYFRHYEDKNFSKSIIIFQFLSLSFTFIYALKETDYNVRKDLEQELKILLIKKMKLHLEQMDIPNFKEYLEQVIPLFPNNKN